MGRGKIKNKLNNPREIEKKGSRFLKHRLEEAGYEVVTKVPKTFDMLIYDKKAGKETYIEVKAKSKGYNKLDFIGFSDKQYKAMEKPGFDVYIICGVNEGKREIYRIKSRDLLRKKFRKVISYEFDRSVLNDIKEKVGK